MFEANLLVSTFVQLFITIGNIINDNDTQTSTQLFAHNHPLRSAYNILSHHPFYREVDPSSYTKLSTLDVLYNLLMNTTPLNDKHILYLSNRVPTTIERPFTLDGKPMDLVGDQFWLCVFFKNPDSNFEMWGFTYTEDDKFAVIGATSKNAYDWVNNPAMDESYIKIHASCYLGSAVEYQENVRIAQITKKPPYYSGSMNHLYTPVEIMRNRIVIDTLCYVSDKLDISHRPTLKSILEGELYNNYRNLPATTLLPTCFDFKLINYYYRDANAFIAKEYLKHDTSLVVDEIDLIVHALQIGVNGVSDSLVQIKLPTHSYLYCVRLTQVGNSYVPTHYLMRVDNTWTIDQVTQDKRDNQLPFISLREVLKYLHGTLTC